MSLEEFCTEYIDQQSMLCKSTMEKIAKMDQSGLSFNAMANVTILMQSFQKLVGGLINDIQTGKITKPPRRFKKWSEKKTKQQRPQEVLVEMDITATPQFMDQGMQPNPQPPEIQNIDPELEKAIEELANESYQHDLQNPNDDFANNLKSDDYM